jgi:1-deoxy-D-xylulose-5-phosphate reductoisomerase
MALKYLVVLGSTGSVGKSTLDVVARHPGLYRIFALVASTNVAQMLEQCKAFAPEFAVMNDAGAALKLEQLCVSAGLPTRVLAGAQGIIEVVSAPKVNSVMAAIVGAAGLLPSIKAASCGKTVLLANKEALVMAGDVFLAAARQGGAKILPIDSEHNAVFQCLPPPASGASTHQALGQQGISRVVLTASGGPFLRRSLASLAQVTPDQACAHPKWSMGRKISTDSATLMNKGLELLEAQLLFDLSARQLEVVVHPQSIIHSMVDYCDGSMLAQLGNPDMRTPIAQALAYPSRIASGVAPLDITKMGDLTFEAPDEHRFACLGLAMTVLHERGNRACVLNAANEVAVAAFLEERLPFLRIPAVIESTLERLQSSHVPSSIDEIMALDAQARIVATQALQV